MMNRRRFFQMLFAAPLAAVGIARAAVGIARAAVGIARAAESPPKLRILYSFRTLKSRAHLNRNDDRYAISGLTLHRTMEVDENGCLLKFHQSAPTDPSDRRPVRA